MRHLYAGIVCILHSSLFNSSEMRSIPLVVNQLVAHLLLIVHVGVLLAQSEDFVSRELTSAYIPARRSVLHYIVEHNLHRKGSEGIVSNLLKSHITLTYIFRSKSILFRDTALTINPTFWN